MIPLDVCTIRDSWTAGDRRGPAAFKEFMHDLVDYIAYVLKTTHRKGKYCSQSEE